MTDSPGAMGRLERVDSVRLNRIEPPWPYINNGEPPFLGDDVKALLALLREAQAAITAFDAWWNDEHQAVPPDFADCAARVLAKIGEG